MKLAPHDVLAMTAAEIVANWSEIELLLLRSPTCPLTAAAGELSIQVLRWMTPEEIADRFGEVSNFLVNHLFSTTGGFK